jgi:hypothetical protein
MALRKLIAGGNNVREQKNSGTVAFKMKHKWENRLSKIITR